MNRGKSNWEHLNEDLHVLITVEDTKNRALVKLDRAKEEVKKLLVPAVSTAKMPADPCHTPNWLNNQRDVEGTLFTTMSHAFDVP